MNSSRTKMSAKELLRFIIPSIIGIFLFILPLPWGGGDWTIGVGYMASLFKAHFGFILPAFMLVVVMVSAVLTLCVSLFKFEFVRNNAFLSKLLMVKPLTLVIRVLSAIVAVILLYGITGTGFDMITNPNTGGTVSTGLFPVLATWFFFSGFFLPLLMEFGSMDYLGTLIRRFMRPLFKVPGRSAIDALASWIGSGPVGVVITDKQYTHGYYTQQESSIIAVCFSMVSLPFAVFVADFLNISKSFMLFYGTITIASVVSAIILPRIFPLSRKSTDYCPNTTVRINEEVPAGKTVHQWAVERAVERAKAAPSLGGLAKSGLATVVDVYLSLMPIVLLLGTAALIIAEYTPVFAVISKPLVPIFNLMRVPDAGLAASSTLVGFADMFLPAIFVKGSEFEITRFIIGALSFTQLIYMTETGAIILRASIPLNFFDLAVVFIERTLITLPIVVLLAHVIY